ncbi:MAG: allantoinase AllB [Bacteroidota bacterium]
MIIRSSNVLTPQGLRPATVVVEDGKIQDVQEYDFSGGTSPVEDAGALVVMPGLVDTHVHINDPGRSEWEGFETATKAAAAGGITTVVDMPLNSSPVTTTVAALNQKSRSASGRVWVDWGMYAGLIPGNANHLPALIDSGVLGVKAFLVRSGLDEFPRVSEGDLRAGMPVIADSGLPLLVHCELADGPNPVNLADRSYKAYLSSRPGKWEHNAINLMIRLCKEFRCRVHVVHLSSADAVGMLSQARKSGLPITVETCPHYLTFAAEEISDGDTRFKCAPPIREGENRERLWKALRERAIDFVVSDHSPCAPEMKLISEGNFSKAWGGISSLQLGLPIVWTGASKRGFSIADVARWMSEAPATFVGLGGQKGAIAPGYDADFVVWNPDEEFVVKRSQLLHRHKMTPYEGMTLRGKVVATYLGGRKIYEKGNVATEPSGQLLRRKSKGVSRNHYATSPQ